MKVEACGVPRSVDNNDQSEAGRESFYIFSLSFTCFFHTLSSSQITISVFFFSPSRRSCQWMLYLYVDKERNKRMYLRWFYTDIISSSESRERERERERDETLSTDFLLFVNIFFLVLRLLFDQTSQLTVN